jgi:CHAD domain-containing protein
MNVRHSGFQQDKTMNDLEKTPSQLTLAEGFTRAARQHLERLREGEKKIRSDGDLEGVHLMRTSCRRLRATVKYLGDHLPKADRKDLQRGLRELMAALGPVRDLDVLRAAIGAVDSLDSIEAEGLCKEVAERLAAATLRMQEALGGADYAGLQENLERGLRAARPDVPVLVEGPARIMNAMTGVLRLKPADWSAAAEESLHDLRKSLKRLRYALEAFAPAYGRPVSRQIDRCRELQESLGTLQDAAVFASHLKGLRTFVAGQFIATMRSRAEVQMKELPGFWEKAFGPKGMARLGGHLFRRCVRPRKVRQAPPERQQAV